MLIENKEIRITGKLVRVAALKEEWDSDIADPESFLRILKNANTHADLFTFTQRLPESTPKFDYYMEWDSCAAIPIIDYDYWLKKQVCQNSRKKIGLAKRKGVEIRLCDFSDDLVHSIIEIYHETPILQGKPNRQYNTDFETAKRLNSTFLDRAQFIGAYYKGELIAYIKLVDAKRFMRTMGILVKVAHRDKGAMNLLIAKAVEICAERGLPYLTYASFNYGKRGSGTLRDFKKNLGFESIILPRYYIPFNGRGKMQLALKLHKGIGDLLPERLTRAILNVRNQWYEKKYSAEMKEN